MGSSRRMRFKLTDPWFEAQFLRDIKRDRSCTFGGELEGAQGLFMYCSCGYGNFKRAHGLQIPFADRGVPENFGPVDDSGARPRWKVSGTGMADLTLKPSVLVGTSKDSCWHGHIEKGVVT